MGTIVHHNYYTIIVIQPAIISLSYLILTYLRTNAAMKYSNNNNNSNESITQSGVMGWAKRRIPLLIHVSGFCGCLCTLIMATSHLAGQRLGINVLPTVACAIAFLWFNAIPFLLLWLVINVLARLLEVNFGHQVFINKINTELVINRIALW